MLYDIILVSFEFTATHENCHTDIQFTVYSPSIWKPKETEPLSHVILYVELVPENSSLKIISLHQFSIVVMNRQSQPRINTLFSLEI